MVGVALEELAEDTGQVTVSVLLELDEVDEVAWDDGRPEQLALSPTAFR